MRTYPAAFLSVRSAGPAMLSPENEEDEEGGGKSELLDEITRHLTVRRVMMNLLEEGLGMHSVLGEKEYFRMRPEQSISALRR